MLFLVDRANLGRQTLREFQAFATPDDGRKLTDLYNVQHLQSSAIDPVARVVITTIQRLHRIIRGDADVPEELDELSGYELEPAAPVEVSYNPAVPIETFDVIVVDECHRSIYGVWRQVLEYFDAHLIGLTATPGKQTFGFFDQNLVMEYGHEQAVADRVNVDFDVFRIRTEISEQGSTIDGGLVTQFRDRETRELRLERVDEEIVYDARALDRQVVAKDQIRTIVRTFRERLPEIFPGRNHVPKTLIFAKDDSHADDIVQIVREEFGKGNDFTVKITYKSGSQGQRPEQLLQDFRTTFNPRIAVTVDMIATGTDVKPLECVFFMRVVKSRNFFEQMKGRGVRVIDPSDLRAVTPDAPVKDRFVIVDAVGVTETDLTDTVPLERRPGVPLERLLHQLALGMTDDELVSSVASRLARLDHRMTKADRAAIEEQFSRLDATEATLGNALMKLKQVRKAVLRHHVAGDWPGVTLMEVAEVRLGRQRSPRNHSGPNMTPYLRAANVTWAGLDLSDVKEMNFSSSEVATYTLRDGDVLLSEASGSASEVGKPAVWREEIPGCCFQNTLIRVRSSGPRPEFLKLVFLHAALSGEFAKAAPGVGIHHLGAERLARWPIPLPPLEEQRQIAAEVERQLSIVDATRAAIDRALERSKQLRRSILERAFTGKLVPQDPTDEPASVLLERIRAERAADKPERSSRRRASMGVDGQT